jgi:hypothetical protein
VHPSSLLYRYIARAVCDGVAALHGRAFRRTPRARRAFASIVETQDATPVAPSVVE